MKKSIAFAAVAAAVVLTFAFAGCKAKEPEQAPSPLAPVEISKPAVSSIELRYAPDPPVALKDTAFTVVVKDDKGGPITDATVEVDLSMPGMYHGENKPEMAETSPGVYEGKGILTMGGDWVAKVGVSGNVVGGFTEVRFKAVDK